MTTSQIFSAQRKLSLLALACIACFAGGGASGQDKITLTIGSDTTVENISNDKNTILKINDGVTVQTTGSFTNNGEVEASQATVVVESRDFSNSGSAVIGSVSVLGNGRLRNNGENLTINNVIIGSVSNFGGTLTYNGDGPIKGDLYNSGGTIYATKGTLRVEGEIRIQGGGSAIWKNANEQLVNIEATGTLTVEERPGKGVATLDADSLSVESIINYGHIKAKKITAKSSFTNVYVENGESSIEADLLTIGNYVDDSGNSWSSVIGLNPSGYGQMGNSVVTVHQKLFFDSSNGTPTLENWDRLLFAGNDVEVEGTGKIVNQGVIAKNNNKDPDKDPDSVDNLTIKAEIINQGKLYTKNLSVLKGVDGIEQDDGSFKDSHVFKVDNLTVLENGDFSLQSQKTELQNLTVQKGASLYAPNSVTLAQSLSGEGTLNTGEKGEVSLGKASSIGALSGSGTVHASNGILVQNISDFQGTLRAQGDSGIGVSTLQSNPDKVTLTLSAGSKIDKATVIVGKDDSANEPVRSLTVLPDASLAIVVDQNYDGSSPLVTAPSAYIANEAYVTIVNAADLKNGTTVIGTTEGDAPVGYELYAKTDNLFKVIRNNQIQTLNTSEALGTDILGGSVFADALNGNGLARARVASLTTGTTASAATDALTRIALMGTAGAVQTVSVNASNMITDTLVQHGSLLAAYSHEKQGPDLWIDLNGTFSKASGYQAGTSNYGYKSDLAGATIGTDYAFGNGITTGLAFSVGTGSVRGQGLGSGVKNDIDYWGLNIYGVWTTNYFNLLGNIGFLQTKNKITQSGFKGKPDAKTISLGLRAEKSLHLNEAITVTPHIGVRYFNVDMDSFEAGGFKYSSDKVNLVQLPFGVAFNANLKAACGAEIKPYIDVQISPAFGNRKATNKFAVEGGSVTDAFDARVANNAMYSAKLGAEVTRGNHSFGLNYGLGSGDYGRVDQVLQAKYRYSF